MMLWGIMWGEIGISISRRKEEDKERGKNTNTLVLAKELSQRDGGANKIGGDEDERDADDEGTL